MVYVVGCDSHDNRQSIRHMLQRPPPVVETEKQCHTHPALSLRKRRAVSEVTQSSLSVRKPPLSIVPLSPIPTSSSSLLSKTLADMTLVTRSAIRLSRRGGQALKTARTNAAFLNTAASSAKNVLPKFAAPASRVNLKAAQGESWFLL